jgi:hypothetical protein
VVIPKVCSKLSIMAGVFVVVLASNRTAFTGTVNVKGSGSFTSVGANFSFDGTSHPGNPNGTAGQELLTGTDNIGGPFTGQEIGEYTLDFSTSCTAPDGSAGGVFLGLIDAVRAVTYNQGQLYSFAVGPSSGCISTSTGAFVETETHTVFGGTDKFAHASGSITLTLTGRVLASPAPPGFGLFTAATITETGSITD